jgi:hypothetical protein
MKCGGAAACGRNRETLAARERADDHELGVGTSDRAEIARELAVDKDLDVRTDRALFVDDAKTETGKTGVEIGGASASVPPRRAVRRRRSPRRRVRAQQCRDADLHPFRRPNQATSTA